MKYKILWLASLFIASSVYADDEGGHEGGGGDSIVCYEQSAKGVEIARRLTEKIKKNQAAFNDPSDPELLTGIKSVESYDLWVHTSTGFNGRPRGLFTPKGMTASEIVDEVLKRAEEKLLNIDELREARAQLNWRGYAGVKEVIDEGRSGQVDPWCVAVQIAFQKDNEVEYNRLLVAKMNVPNQAQIDQAALELHEIFKAQALKYGRRDTSFYIHTAVGMLFSDAQFWHELNPLQLSNAVAKIIRGQGEYYAPLKMKIEGRHHQFVGVSLSRYRLDDQKTYAASIDKDTTFYLKGPDQYVPLATYSNILFNDKGEILGLMPRKPIQLYPPNWTQAVTFGLIDDGRNFHKIKNGWVVSGLLEKKTAIDVGQQRYCFYHTSYINFHSNGVVQSGLIDYDISGSRFEFDENGRMKDDKGITQELFQKGLKACK